jgi:hypothetical protein
MVPEHRPPIMIASVVHCRDGSLMLQGLMDCDATGYRLASQNGYSTVQMEIRNPWQWNNIRLPRFRLIYPASFPGLLPLLTLTLIKSSSTSLKINFNWNIFKE